MKTNEEMLLKILTNGNSVKCKDYGKLALDEDYNTVMTTQVGLDEECFWYIIDLTLKDFIQLANSFNRDALWLKCCEIELQKMNTSDEPIGDVDPYLQTK